MVEKQIPLHSPGIRLDLKMGRMDDHFSIAFGVLSILVLAASIGAGVYFVTAATSDQFNALTKLVAEGNAIQRSTLNGIPETEQKLSTLRECSTRIEDAHQSDGALLTPAPP